MIRKPMIAVLPKRKKVQHRVRLAATANARKGVEEDVATKTD
jgi:hypothetical protein